MEYYENPKRNIRSAGLLIKRRSTPQSMFGGDGGERDSVRLFKLCIFKRSDSMKDNEALYLTIINRPKSADEWPTRTRMGENTIGSIVKSMTSCLFFFFFFFFTSFFGNKFISLIKYKFKQKFRF